MCMSFIMIALLFGFILGLLIVGTSHLPVKACIWSIGGISLVPFGISGFDRVTTASQRFGQYIVHSRLRCSNMLRHGAVSHVVARAAFEAWLVFDSTVRRSHE